MARDYKSLLDLATAPVSEEMAALTGMQPAQPVSQPQQMMLDSELPGPQPMQQQQGGGGQGLLDVLGAIGSGVGTGLLGVLQAIPEVAAYRQAALGNAEPLKMMQEQKQQKQLTQQLEQMASSGEFGEFGSKIQTALKTGGPKAAQKVAAQIPAFKSISDLVKKSNLSTSEKEAVLNAGLVDPNRALDLYRSLAIIEKQQVGRQAVESAKEQRELRREERKIQKAEAKLPGAILASEIEKGTVDLTDIPSVLGLLQAKGVKIPGSPAEQQLWVKNLLANPNLKKYVKVEEKPGLIQSMLNFFKGTSQPAAQPAQPVQQPAQPATAAAPATLTSEQQRRLEELRRKRGR